MSELSKMEVGKCPLCSGEFFFDDDNFHYAWRHPFDTVDNRECPLLDIELQESEHVKRWNRRSPAPAIVEAWEGMMKGGSQEDRLANRLRLHEAVREYVEKGGAT